jgi:hypothetical protein
MEDGVTSGNMKEEPTRKQQRQTHGMPNEKRNGV